MRRLLAVILSGALLLGACGGSGSSENAKDTLVGAIEGLSEMESVTLTLTLDSTTESLVALGEDSGDQLSEEDAEKILDSSVAFSAAGEGDIAAGRFLLTIAGTDAVDVRVVDKIVYARVDATGIAETFGGDTSELDLAAQQAAASGFDFVGPLLEGEWVSLDFGQLEQELGGQLPTPTASSDESLRELESILRDTASVSSEGSDDAGEHLVVELPLRETYSRIIDDIAGLGAQLPPGAEFPDISEVPDENLRLDAWVDDGRLTQIELDFLQFVEMTDEEPPEGVEDLGMRLAIDEFEGTVEAPPESIEIDLEKLMQSIFGAMMGTDSAGGAAGNDAFCSQLEGQPREVLELYEEQCPDLLKK